MAQLQDLAADLRHRLSQPLPGPAAMQPWTPQLAYGRHFAPPPHNVRSSAVAMLIYVHDGQWHVPLTLRPATMSSHAGQVSLPGGSIDAGESPEDAAWRELREELGVARETFEPLGRLTPLYIFASNFHVVPCVALAHEPPTFTPHAGEVERVVELPLASLAEPQAREEMQIERGRLSFRAPCFRADGLLVWGASAMMTAELAAFLCD